MGKKLTEDEKSLGSAVLFLLVIVLVLIPIYAYYYYIFDLKKRTESILGKKDGFWSSLGDSFGVLSERLEKDHDDYYELVEIKRLTWIVIGLTVITLFLLSAFLGKYT